MILHKIKNNKKSNFREKKLFYSIAILRNYALIVEIRHSFFDYQKIFLYFV